MLAGTPALSALLRLPAGALINRFPRGGRWLMYWLIRRQEARTANTEAELDRTQDELRRTVLQLTDVLGAEAHEARRGLIRESYVASRRTPERR